MILSMENAEYLGTGYVANVQGASIGDIIKFGSRSYEREFNECNRVYYPFERSV